MIALFYTKNDELANLIKEFFYSLYSYTLFVNNSTVIILIACASSHVEGHLYRLTFSP